MAEDKNILIEKYIKGTATPEEVLKVEQLIDADPDFAELLNNEQLIQEFIHLGSMVELKAKMKEMNLGKPKGSFSKWGVAASVAILAVLTYLLLPGDGNNEKETSNNQKQVIVVKDSSQKTYEDKPDNVLNDVASDNHNAHERPSSQELKVGNSAIEKDSEEDSISYGIVEKSIFLEGSVPKEKDDALKKDTVIDETIDACEVSFIEPVFEVTPSCEGLSTGEIMIDSINGCFPPYKYRLANNNSLTVNRIFSNLAPGTYNISIFDNEGCSNSFDLIVGEKECIDEEKILSSLNGTPCVFELEEASGVINFYNASGQMINQIPFNNLNALEWYGKDSNGLPLPTGEYFYQIKYSSGKKDVGNVTIAN